MKDGGDSGWSVAFLLTLRLFAYCRSWRVLKLGLRKFLAQAPCRFARLHPCYQQIENSHHAERRMRYERQDRQLFFRRLSHESIVADEVRTRKIASELRASSITVGH